MTVQAATQTRRNLVTIIADELNDFVWQFSLPICFFVFTLPLTALCIYMKFTGEYVTQTNLFVAFTVALFIGNIATFLAPLFSSHKNEEK